MNVEQISTPKYKITDKRMPTSIRNLVFTDCIELFGGEVSNNFLQKRNAILQSVSEAAALRLSVDDWILTTALEIRANPPQTYYPYTDLIQSKDLSGLRHSNPDLAAAHFDQKTRTVAVYFVKDNKLMVAFDDIADTENNLIIMHERGDLSEFGIINLNSRYSPLKEYRLDLENGLILDIIMRAYDTGRIVEAEPYLKQRQVPSTKGKNSKFSNDPGVIALLGKEISELYAGFLQKRIDANISYRERVLANLPGVYDFPFDVLATGKTAIVRCVELNKENICATRYLDSPIQCYARGIVLK